MDCLVIMRCTSALCFAMSIAGAHAVYRFSCLLPFKWVPCDCSGDGYGEWKPECANTLFLVSAFALSLSLERITESHQKC